MTAALLALVLHASTPAVPAPWPVASATMKTVLRVAGSSKTADQSPLVLTSVEG